MTKNLLTVSSYVDTEDFSRLELCLDSTLPTINKPNFDNIKNEHQFRVHKILLT